MNLLDCRPVWFFMTGLAWLLASSLLGLGLFASMVLGTPLPAVVRQIHVHGALVGGITQLILGALVRYLPAMWHTGTDRSDPHPGLYYSMNFGAIGIIVGLSLHLSFLVSGAGILVLGAFVGVVVEGLRQVRSGMDSPPLSLWCYGLAVLVLLGGIGFGEALGLRAFSPSFVGAGRLLHIHLTVLGFLTLTIIGTMHSLLPAVLQTPLYSSFLARLTLSILPVGVIGLITGFLIPNLQIQMMAGSLLLGGTIIFCINMVATWVIAGKPGSIASDHLLVATMFLAITIITGTLVSVNALWDPPKLPFGTLHLSAYTHLAFIGFIMQAAFGALSYLLPVSLAVSRIPNSHTRALYLDGLCTRMNRWRALQVGTLSMGTLGLGLVASLVWQYPLSHQFVAIATYSTLGLLFASLLLFAIKVGNLWGYDPSD